MQHPDQLGAVGPPGLVDRSLHVSAPARARVGLLTKRAHGLSQGGGARRQDLAGAARAVVAYRLPHVVRRGVGEVRHLTHGERPFLGSIGERDGDHRFQQPRDLHGGGVHRVVAAEFVVEGQPRAVADRTDEHHAVRDLAVLGGRRKGPGLVDHVK